MNTQLLYANSILLSPHLFMSPVNYLLSDSANKPTSNDEGASIVCLSNLFAYSTFRANLTITGGLIFVTLISFPKLHFLYIT